MTPTACIQCGYPVGALISRLCPRCLLRAGGQGPYTVLTVLGRDEHGAIYLAEHPWRRGLVAVKVLNPDVADRGIVERLRRVTGELATLSVPSIALPLEVGWTPDQRPYLVRDYVQGVPITRFCERARLTGAAKRRLLGTVSASLAAAHQRPIAHGGITPSNILVRDGPDEPVVTVVDFGVRIASMADDTAAMERLAAMLR